MGPRPELMLKRDTRRALRSTALSRSVGASAWAAALACTLVACTAADTDRVAPVGSPPPLTPSSAGPESDPGAVLFDNSQVVEMTITLDDRATKALLVSPREWVAGDLTWDGHPLAKVGFRLKGNGSFQPLGDKPSFKIELDRYVDDQELDGLDELVLNNMVSDATMMREHTAYQVYRELGVPAPRTTHVNLMVNGQPYGVYLLLEDTDGRFLNRWYADGDGPLFEMFDVDFVSEDIERFDHDGGDDDRDTLYGLAGVLADPDARLSEEGRTFVDLEQFATYFAISGVIGQFDAYPFSVPGDDVFVYIDPTDGLIDMLPHGGDETFTERSRPVDYAFGALGAKCLADSICEQLWAEAVWNAWDAMDDMNLRKAINDTRLRLEPWTQMDGRQPWPPGDIQRQLDDIREFVRHRDIDLDGMPGLPAR